MCMIQEVKLTSTQCKDGAAVWGHENFKAPSIGQHRCIIIATWDNDDIWLLSLLKRKVTNKINIFKVF